MSGWNRIFVPSFGEVYYHGKKSEKKNGIKTKFNKDIGIVLLETEIEALKVKINKNDWNLSLKSQLEDKEKILAIIKNK